MVKIGQTQTGNRSSASSTLDTQGKNLGRFESALKIQRKICKPSHQPKPKPKLSPEDVSGYDADDSDSDVENPSRNYKKLKQDQVKLNHIFNQLTI